MMDDVNIGSPECTGNVDGRAVDDVFRRIAGRILSGELADGQPLPPEREIIKAFGVSRTGVREAVLALANGGLVRARLRHRPVVRKSGYDTAFETLISVVERLLNLPGGVKHLFDKRVMIEASLVRQAALDARKEDIAAMRAALMANEAAIENSEPFYGTDVEFHSTFYGIPGNPVLPANHRACTAWLSPHWYRMPSEPDRNRADFEFHGWTFEAMLMRNPDTAGERLKLHLAYAWDQVRETFDNAWRSACLMRQGGTGSCIWTG